MIAAWMIYSVAVTFLLYAAAVGAEHVARALRLPTRLAWVLAMTAAVVLSARALLRRPDAPLPASAATSSARPVHYETPTPIVDRGTKSGSTTISTSGARFRTIERSASASISGISSSALDRWNQLLIVAWAASFVLVMVWLLVAFRRLRRLGRRLTPGTAGNHTVLVSDDVGPALVGILRTRIVLPRWVLALPLAEQEVIVEHERQHAAAFDPALVCASLCIAALQPWNAPLWVLLARLRLAVEADCDRRVLGEGGDARAYGRLLVAMYERTSGLSPHVAFAERASNLERRIRRMTSRPRIFSSAVGVSAIAATVFATAAWKSPVPTRTAPSLSPAARATAMLRALVPGTTTTTTTPAHSAAPSPTESVPRSGGGIPVRAEPHSIVASDSQQAEPPAVTFKQIVIAARDSNDVARAASLADTVADLLRNGVAFDSLAAKYHDFAGHEMTGPLGPWPLDSLPLAYQEALAVAKIGDIVTFQVPGTLRRSEVPKFVVAQLIAIHRPAVYVDPISGVPAPRSGGPQVLQPGALAQASSIRVTMESYHAQYRLEAPQDSTMQPLLLLGRATINWGTPAGPSDASPMMEITSLDSTSQIHVEAAQNGRVVASGEGAYLILRRDSAGITIEAWSHVPPSSSQESGKPVSRAMSNVHIDAEQAIVVAKGGGRAGAPIGSCAMPDSIAIRGLSRVRDADARSALGITPRTPISGAVVTQALKNLYATNNFESNATTTCEVIGAKSILVFNITERRSSDADSDLVRVGYVQRKQTATGFFVDSSEIDRRSPRFSDAVRAFPGLRVSPSADGRMNVIMQTNGGCVTTFIDGVPFRPMGPGDLEDVITLKQVIAIELYQPSSTPQQFVRRDEPNCAALVVWTEELRHRRR